MPNIKQVARKQKRRRYENYNVNEGYEGEKVDLISNLPNDILVYLLSFLEMKTAGRTSILSKRWKYVWTYITYLDFDDSEILKLMHCNKKSIASESDRYNRWVNQVISASRAPYLNTFQIHFPLYGLYAADILKWLKFASTKKVCNLELNLSYSLGCPYEEIYIIRRESLFSWPTYHHYTTLKSLHLEALSVEGFVLEYFLSNFLNLERLTLRRCIYRFACYTFVVSSLKLKHLELINCSQIESFKISAPKLTSFIFFSWKEKRVEYSSVPSLVNVTYGGSYCNDMFLRNLHIVSCFSCQLEKISLHWNRESSAPTAFPAFPNVKHLEFIVKDLAGGDDNLFALISFIEACPLLHTFKLELSPWALRRGVAMYARKDVQINAIRAHQHLEVVEFVGYAGTTCAAELALCLIEHTPMLKKIIFDPRPQSAEVPYKVYYIDIMEKICLARTQAELLVRRIHRGGIDVVIL